MKLLIDRFGHEKVVMGSDYPFLLREIPPGKVIDDTLGLTEEQRQAILGGNALAFLNIRIKEEIYR